MNQKDNNDTNQPSTGLSRRRFLQSTAATAAVLGMNAGGQAAASATHQGAHSNPVFNMKFAPHQGHFKHHAGDNVLDQIRFAYDLGFRAWEDNRMPKRDVKEQKAIGDLLAQLGMEMGVFVAYTDFRNPVMAGNRLNAANKRLREPKAVREMLVKTMVESVEIAKRAGAKWCTIVPATTDDTLPFEYQTENVVENLKYMSEVCEKSGLIMVLEPLNNENHPNCFLTKTAQAYQVCKMVDSPSCKILNDLYHQQITEGNLIKNMQHAWDEIAYIQVGDVPGRKEPGTGEINYKHIMQWLDNKGYKGIIGAEHGIKAKGKAGEVNLIQAYRDIDIS